MASMRTDAIKFLTLQETTRLFHRLASYRREKAIFLLAYRHGLRASEVGMLRIEDIDFKTLRIMIHRLKGSHSGEHGVLCISPQKGSIQITPVVPIRISANSRRISSTLTLLGCLRNSFFGSDRLGITAIYLSLIDMHVVVTMLRIGRGSFSSRLEIPD